jgi:hypothetical protein
MHPGLSIKLALILVLLHLQPALAFLVSKSTGVVGNSTFL